MKKLVNDNQFINESLKEITDTSMLLFKDNTSAVIRNTDRVTDLVSSTY